jgi:transcriptional regulator with XRE-family HTH domain
MKQENIVKKVCKELGITQKELAEKMGVNDVTVRNWSSKGNPPDWAVNFMNLLLEYEKVKEKADKAKKLVEILEELKK